MKEKDKESYQAPTLVKLGAISKITAGGTYSPAENHARLKSGEDPEEYKEGP